MHFCLDKADKEILAGLERRVMACQVFVAFANILWIFVLIFLCWKNRKSKKMRSVRKNIKKKISLAKNVAKKTHHGFTKGIKGIKHPAPTVIHTNNRIVDVPRELVIEKPKLVAKESSEDNLADKLRKNLANFKKLKAEEKLRENDKESDESIESDSESSDDFDDDDFDDSFENLDEPIYQNVNQPIYDNVNQPIYENIDQFQHNKHVNDDHQYQQRNRKKSSETKMADKLREQLQLFRMRQKENELKESSEDIVINSTQESVDDYDDSFDDFDDSFDDFEESNQKVHEPVYDNVPNPIYENVNQLLLQNEREHHHSFNLEEVSKKPSQIKRKNKLKLQQKSFRRRQQLEGSKENNNEINRAINTESVPNESDNYGYLYHYESDDQNINNHMKGSINQVHYSYMEGQDHHHLAEDAVSLSSIISSTLLKGFEDVSSYQNEYMPSLVSSPKSSDIFNYNEIRQSQQNTSCDHHDANFHTKNGCLEYNKNKQMDNQSNLKNIARIIVQLSKDDSDQQLSRSQIENSDSTDEEVENLAHLIQKIFKEPVVTSE